MRRGIVFLGILTVLVGGFSAQANLLVNGGFEEGDTGQVGSVAIPGWNSWGTNGWLNNDAGAVIDTKSMKFWWDGIGIWQDYTAIPGQTYIYSVQVIDASRDTSSNNWDLQIEAEFYDAANTQLTAVVLGYFDSTIEPDDTWVEIGGSIEAPAGTVYGRVVLRTVDWQEGIAGALYFDNVSVIDASTLTQAYDPIPADGADVGLDLTALAWSNPDPNNPADTISCDVYFEVDDGDPNFYIQPIATGITDGTILLADYGITLQDDTNYTWRVDCTDPNTPGMPVITKGALWTFRVTDVPPVANAGDNQYLWIYMDDIDGEPNQVTFTVTGTYTDDGKSPIIRAEWVQGTHQGGGTVTILSQSEPVPGTVEAVVNATANGWLSLRFEVEDAAGVATDTMNVGIYNSCLEAALADPSDTIIETNWPNGQHGDINGDCKTNLEDFAIMASTWVECMTVKAGCTP